MARHIQGVTFTKGGVRRRQKRLLNRRKKLANKSDPWCPKDFWKEMAKIAIRMKFERKSDAKNNKKAIAPITTRPARSTKSSSKVDLYSRWYQRFGFQSGDSGSAAVSGESHRLLGETPRPEKKVSKKDKTSTRRPF